MRTPARWWHDADRRLQVSAVALAVVLLGWPASAAWVWGVKGFDPFEQLMLLLSWGALGYTAGNMLITSKVGESSCPHCPHCNSASSNGG